MKQEIKQQWRELEQRFARLARRELGILLGGGLAVILIVGFSLADSSLARQRLLNKEIVKAQSDTKMAKAQAEVIVRQLAEDPDARARKRIAALLNETRSLDTQMQGLNRGLIAPEQMAEILQKMLSRDRGVKLVGLKTLPVSHLIDGKQTNDGANVYKHGIEITLQGRYLDMLDYLDRLEGLPWQMFWSQASMEAKDYPAVRITVTVFTLSLDEDWLVV
jgi:MSHA biogenesis protein MshJ